MTKKAFIPAWTAAMLAMAVASMAAESIRCLDLAPVDNPAIAYAKRGTRCEGFYQAPVSAGSLSLAGLLHGRLQFDPEHDPSLLIVSPKVRSKPVHVQGAGIPMRTYYRLDALLEPGGSLEWPLDIVRKTGLRPNQIGLLGQLADEKDVFVPLSVSAVAVAPLILTIRSSVDVGGVKWRKEAMDAGKCDLAKAAWQSLLPKWGDRFFSGEAIELSLPDQIDDFCIEFAAQEAISSSWLKLPLKIRMKD